MTGTADDPFAHLHDEAYARAFDTRTATADTLITLAGRRTVSLDGPWHLTLDLFDEGLRQRWFALDDMPASQWATPRDYEIEAGDLVPVPLPHARCSLSGPPITQHWCS